MMKRIRKLVIDPEKILINKKITYDTE